MSEAVVLTLVILAFLVFGLALLATLSLVPATSTAARGLWPVMVSELVIVAVALAFVLPAGLVTALGVTLLAGRCGWEAATVVLAKAPNARRRARGVGLAAAVAAGLTYTGGATGGVAGLVLVAVAAIAAARIGRSGGTADGLLLILFPLAPLVAFASVAGWPGGAAILLLAFLLVETMDSTAVLGGRLFGRHKAFPRLSPRKTVEGLTTGAVAVALAAALLGGAVLQWPAGRIVVVAGAVAIATVAGDLIASHLKRRAGVKDYPTVHPVQGGLLDIVDAWIVAAPVLAVVARLV